MDNPYERNQIKIIDPYERNQIKIVDSYERNQIKTVDPYEQNQIKTVDPYGQEIIIQDNIQEFYITHVEQPKEKIEKRYEILDEPIYTYYCDQPLYRILYLVDGPENIKKGDLGGLILKEKADEILPQNGNGWVYYNSFAIGGTLMNGVIKNVVMRNDIWNTPPIGFIVSDDITSMIVSNCAIGEVQIGCMHHKIEDWIKLRDDGSLKRYISKMNEKFYIDLNLALNECIQQQKKLFINLTY